MSQTGCWLGGRNREGEKVDWLNGEQNSSKFLESEFEFKIFQNEMRLRSYDASFVFSPW